MKKIAIACQGGGSQTAFTAGVLRSIFASDIEREVEIVSLSGTSGGAICAALAWSGLLKRAAGDLTPIPQRIFDFWQELTARLPAEQAFDDAIAAWLRIIDRGVIPHFEMSPASIATRSMMSFVSSLLPRAEFTDLKAMLEKHIDFSELKALVEDDSPVLLIGAADVLTGELKKFNSRKGEICVEAILASAAVPTLFPAVEVAGHYYWDGLFSDNPPVQELIRARSVGAQNIPDDVWVIQINPTECKTVPTTPGEIIDRRNQMIGNISLMQNLELIEIVNLFLREGALRTDVLEKFGITKHDPIDVCFIRMSDDLLGSLDYVSKLTRGPRHIETLMADGESQGQKFIDEYLARKPTDGSKTATRARQAAVEVVA